MKKYIDVTPDGSIELFKLPEEFIDIPIVQEILIDNSIKYREAIVMGTEYIQVSPAPSFGSKLIILYDKKEVEVGVMTKAELAATMNVLSELNISVTNLHHALSKRVTKDEYAQWTNIVDDKLKELNAKVNLALS